MQLLHKTKFRVSFLRCKGMTKIPYYAQRVTKFNSFGDKKACIRSTQRHAIV